MLRREHRGKLHDFGFGNDFNMTPKSQATKEKDKQGYVKI